jgi:23S rRNA-/tRNA-specific pseudouridylate synthase
VHLAAAGWPIAGDQEYGGSPLLEGRHALHASHLSFDGAARVAAFSVDSELPAELRALLAEGIRGQGSGVRG